MAPPACLRGPRAGVSGCPLAVGREDSHPRKCPPHRFSSSICPPQFYQTVEFFLGSVRSFL
ncbi:MAG: hypothetical protein BJ554DRAFT_7125 [Olpidium bornovanus]|uniref:Uncharacterized protein n=1 Tax=Olpidium bornovanus TaxID=278681 RepID=A0A8H7ZWL1_9FUNG|nr:MAG: hypothetical protein BJ554DRAFT_7125 [Olpidium bornovanus]